MSHSYKTEGTCAKNITFDLDGDVVRNVKFTGGCNGNLQAIQALVEGLTVDEIEQKCKGITCGPRSTSCTDQLAIAIRDALKNGKEDK